MPVPNPTPAAAAPASPAPAGAGAKPAAAAPAGGGAPPAQGAGAAAPANGQPANGAPAGGAAAPVVEQPPESKLPKIDKLTRKEQALRAEEAKLAAERKTWEEQRKQLEAEAAEAKRYKALKTNPVALARELGMTPQQFLELAAKGDSTDPAVIAALAEAKAKTEALEKQVQEDKIAREKAEARVASQQQLAHYQGRVQALVEKADERWQLTATAKGFHPNQVLKRAADYCQENGLDQLTADQENKLFEAILDDMEAAEEVAEEKRIETAKWKKKYGSKFAPAAPVPAPKPGASTKSPTLTNDSATAVPPPEQKGKWDARKHLEMVKSRHPEFFAEKK
jgi:hypothetical protein